MRHLFTSIILLSLAANSSSAQWTNNYFPNPVAFGIHNSSFFASGDGGQPYRYNRAFPTKWISADTGINPAYFPITAFGSIGPYVLVDAGYRSTDDGSRWIPMNHMKFVPSCFATMGSLVFSGGIAGSGVWRSTDSGLDWVAAYSGLSNLNVSSLAVSDTTLFAGTASGVFRSINLCQSWQETSMTTGVSGIVVLGTVILAASPGRGIFRSIDNGSTWTNLNSGLFGHSISALVTDGKNVFAGTGVPFWNGSYGDGRGVFMSTDSGQHWDTINYGLPQGPSMGPTDFLSVNALGIFDTLLFVGVWDGGGTVNRTYVRSVPEILHQKGDTTAGVVSEPIASDSIEIYPNPSVGTVTIRSGGTSIFGIRVLNVLGTEVRSLPGERESGMTLDLSKLPSGTYFLEISTAKGSVLRKVVRE